MKRILFVEDDDTIRQNYQAMFEQSGGKWEVTTAADGETALELLKNSSFDIIASDMQMPGMNGIELLTEVRRLHPHLPRIILSGMGDQAVAANSLNCTHIFIAKPFEFKTLFAALDRIASLDAFLQDEKLRILASMMRQLPSFPMIYLKIIEEIESPKSSIQGIAKIITQDPGITAKVLQVANSAVFGFSQTISDPVEAVQQLGMSTVRSITLSAQVYSSLSARSSKHFSADALWNHLNRCAALASQIMRSERRPISEVEDAFTAGMLHDIGLLMLADSLPHELDEVLLIGKREKIPLREAEIAIFGAPHTALAAYLLGLWGLPAPIVEAVAFHQTPEKSSLKQFSALTAIHVANALCDESQQDSLNMDYLTELKVADRVDEWRDLAMASKEQPL